MKSIIEKYTELFKVNCSDNEIENIIRYTSLVEKWNRVYNLVSRKSEPETILNHLFDGIMFSKQVQILQKDVIEQKHRKLKIVDVGSGCGIPGVIISILLPELEVFCLDKIGKKVAFINQVAIMLKLTKLNVVHCRVQQHEGTYEVIVSKGVYKIIPNFLTETTHISRNNTYWVATVNGGRLPDDERISITRNLSYHFGSIKRNIICFKRMKKS